jgi:hypothetical protein
MKQYCKGSLGGIIYNLLMEVIKQRGLDTITGGRTCSGTQHPCETMSYNRSISGGSMDCFTL